MATRERVGMRLLVSVAGPDDARAALAGGVAAAGGLGPPGVLRERGHRGPPLFALESPDGVGGWVDAAHAGGLFAALAGSLTGPDVATARARDADVVGVRGAACRGGRRGPVSQARVAALSALARTAPRAPLGVFP